MNNKKFMNALLFSAALLSTGMMSSCKDYDDDINTLRDRVSAVETSIAELQKQIKEGKWVTSFQRNTAGNGYVLTLSDGSTLEIKDGEKGATGDTGAAGQNGTSWEIDEVSKNWIKVNPDGSKEDTGICAEGTQGQRGPAGEDGKSPYIENGTWMVWDAENEKYVEAGSAVGTASYVVEYEAYWELNIVVADAEGNATTEFHKVILPKTADITSLEVYAYDAKNGILSEPSVDVTLGKNEQGKKVTFNGKTYEDGEILVSNKAQLVAQVNPLNSDASLYKFSLVNSKGETKFEVSEATQNMSTKPLTTRATEADKETPNKGLWNLSLTIPEGVTVDNKAAYSLQTNSINDESTVIASRYDVNIGVITGTTATPFLQEANLEVGKTYTWDEFLKLALRNYDTWEAADYYLAIAKASTAQAAKDGVSINAANKTITVSKSFSTAVTYVRLNYMALNGEVFEDVEGSQNAVAMEITATAGSEITLDDFNWNWDLKKKTVEVAIDGKDVLNGFVNNGQAVTPEYSFVNSEVYVDGMPVVVPDLEKVLGKVTFVSKPDGYGYNDWFAQMTFDETKVFAESYKAVIKLTNADGSEEKTLEFNINISKPTAYTFVRESAYFDGNAAKVYPTIATNGYSDYDMDVLYKFATADLPYVMFSDGHTTGSWFSNEGASEAKISNADVNKAHKVTVTYRPFGNQNLDATTDEITVEVRSQIYDGTIAYEGKALSVSNGIDATLKLSDILFKDQAGKEYAITGNKKDARVVSYTVALDGENAKKYLSLSGNTFGADGNLTISRKDDTVIVNAQDCKVKVSVVDVWGQTKTYDITVKAE